MSDDKLFDAVLTTPSLSYMSIQASLITGADIDYEEKSTINEHIDILKDVKPLAAERPLLNYLCVGQRGHEGSVTSDELMWTVPIAHEPTDAAPFKMVPLVLRENDNDLTPAQQANYALRRDVTYGGRRYWAYYLKRLPRQVSRAVSYITTVKDGESTIKEFRYSDSNLYPEPVKTPTLGTDSNLISSRPDGQYVQSTVVKYIEFDSFDTQEYINVARVMRGNPLMAIMSEILLCTGVDKEVQVDGGDGSPISFTEAIGVQAGIFVSCYHNLAMTNQRVAYNIEVGQTKPFKLRSSNA